MTTLDISAQEVEPRQALRDYTETHYGAKMFPDQLLVSTRQEAQLRRSMLADIARFTDASYDEKTSIRLFGVPVVVKTGTG